MKKLTLLPLLFLCVCVWGQETTRLEKTIDSLISASRNLIDKRKLDEALRISDAAEQLAAEKPGKQSAAYGRVCMNRGLVFQARENFSEAEKWYLEAKNIQTTTPGNEHADYASTLFNLANLYTTKAKYDQAEPLLQEALQIQKKSPGTQSADYASTVIGLGVLNYGRKKYDLAEPFFLEGKAIREKTLGKMNPDYATVLNNLGNLYADTQQFEKSESHFLEALSIREAILGKEHPKYAASLGDLASLYDDMGLYKKAEPIYLEALSLEEKSLGKSTTKYASSLNNLGVLYRNMGQLDKAEKYYTESRDIRAAVLGKSHPQYANSLNNLGNLYRAMGRYEEAERWHLEAKAIREKNSGKTSAPYGSSLNNLANTYLDMGRYDLALSMHLEAKDIAEKNYGIQSLDYANSLNNLGIIYSDLRDFDKSEACYLEAKALREKLLGKEHPVYATSLNNLASLYRNLKRDEKTIPLYLETLSIEEKKVGKEHPEYVRTLKNLGMSYYALKMYDKSDACLQEARDIGLRVMGPANPDYAHVLQALAYLYMSQNRLDEAEPLLLETQSIRKQALGEQHYYYISAINALALLYQMKSDPARAEQYLIERSAREKTLMTGASAFLPSQELGRYTDQFFAGLSYNLSFAQRQHTLTGGCYDDVLFHKGFLLQAILRLDNLARADSSNEFIFRNLRSFEHQLAAEYAKPATERDSSIVAELEEKASELEKELLRSVSGYADAVRQVNWRQVQAALKPGEAAVEFVHFRFYSPLETDSIQYAALVLRPGAAQPQLVPLFEEKTMAVLLRNAANGSNFLKINALYAGKKLAEDQPGLYDLVWKPLETPLKGAQKIYFSPSGLLHRLNLGAIGGPDGKPFGAVRRLSMLGSTRQLVTTEPSKTQAAAFAYLAGGVRYDADSSAIANANKSLPALRRFSTAGGNMPADSLKRSRSGVPDFLPATAAEVREIAQMLEGARIRTKVDTGFYATEEAFKQLGAPSPRIIHLATHGYFFPDPKQSAEPALQEPAVKSSGNPMIRSGLLLAGARNAWLGGKPPARFEDGILTAYEISQVNHSGTELVVLSACETGLGDIVGTEGVYGLQRAFKIAGVKYLIMSLWKVDDKRTKEFMTTFYRYLLDSKNDVPAAFYRAQHDLQARYPHAFDWAGFVLIE